jgi:hypothetical protein
MNPTYFMLLIFLALTSLVEAAVDDSVSRRSSRSSGASLYESDQFAYFQRGVKSVAGYASLAQKVDPQTGDETETPIDRNPFELFKNFQRALEKGFPGLYETLPLGLFEKIGKSVSQMWVEEAALSFDLLKIWGALIHSKEPEVREFLTTRPIQEGNKLYIYESSGERSSGPHFDRPIKFDKVATHFPRHYKYSGLVAAVR